MAACGGPSDFFTYKSKEYTNRLMNGLQNLLAIQAFSDVVLVVGDAKFDAHRVILSASSRYFKAMFVGELAERDQREVAIHEISPAIFSQLLHFVYTGSIEITAENCTELLGAADMLELSEVVSGCSDFLRQHLTEENCIGIYLFADAHSCVQLKTAAEMYIHSNFVPVSQGEEFNSLPKDMLLGILHSEHLHIEAEFQVFCSALRWIQHDLPARRKLVFEVMSPVRFPLISQKQVDKVVNDCSDLSLKIALKKHIQDFQLNRKMCLELRLSKLKPYLMIPRRSARKSLIVIGGYSRPHGGRWSDSKTLNTVEKFDLFRQQWRNLPNMQYSRSGHGVAELNGLIYAIGGECNSLIYDSAECFDPLNNKWTLLPHMISPRSGMGVCSVYNCLYALGGWVGAEIGETVERFDPSINQWQVVGRAVTLRFSMAVIAYEGLIYVLGGMNDMGMEMKTVESYNPVTHEWTKLTSMSTRRAYAGAAVLDGQIYVVGGRNDHDGTLATVEKYSIEKDDWTEISPMSVPRAGAGVCAINGMMYVIGGRSTSSEYSAPSTLTSVECYDPQTDTWLDIGDMPTGRCEGGVVAL